MPVIHRQILILSDSKSALTALRCQSKSSRSDLVCEILFLIHQLITRGIDVTLLWVPGHSNLRGNDLADFYAKDAARNNSDVLNCDILLSSSEAIHILTSSIWNIRKKQYLEDSARKHRWDVSKPTSKCCNPPGPIPNRNLVHRLRVNGWLGRYLKPAPVCACGQTLDIPHFLFDCISTKIHFQPLHDKMKSFKLSLNMANVFNPSHENGWSLAMLAVFLIKSHPLGRYF